ncbi:MAG: hypothetical protein DME17_08825 [Candidatus Rokuibacteriota bacterium]|nr:MAG: hypothetical protein DME17_08825 [Candidatus Rokubacteria bacterium]
MKGWRMLVGTLALVAALTAARPAEAEYLEDAGWGALTVLTNVAYMPAKLCYATLGGLTGGFAFALTGGDLQTAETVWVTSMGGTYVITPSMLQGQEPIVFTGTPSGSGSNTTADTRSVEERPLGGS